jgi:hypothetical protein
MIETNRRTLQNARGERYGWNPHISSIARTPYPFWKREDTGDDLGLVADASSTALVWIYLFVIGDRPEQRRWAVVFGDDLALRGHSCAPAADRQGPVVERRTDRGHDSSHVLGSSDQCKYGRYQPCSKHILCRGDFPTRWLPACKRWTHSKLRRLAGRLSLQAVH